MYTLRQGRTTGLGFVRALDNPVLDGWETYRHIMTRRFFKKCIITPSDEKKKRFGKRKWYMFVSGGKNVKGMGRLDKSPSAVKIRYESMTAR